MEQPLWENSLYLLKMLNIVTINPVILLQNLYPKEKKKHVSIQKWHTDTYSNITHNSQVMEKIHMPINICLDK